MSLSSLSQWASSDWWCARGEPTRKRPPSDRAPWSAGSLQSEVIWRKQRCKKNFHFAMGGSIGHWGWGVIYGSGAGGPTTAVCEGLSRLTWDQGWYTPWSWSRGCCCGCSDQGSFMTGSQDKVGPTMKLSAYKRCWPLLERELKIAFVRTCLGIQTVVGSNSLISSLAVRWDPSLRGMLGSQGMVRPLSEGEWVWSVCRVGCVCLGQHWITQEVANTLSPVALPIRQMDVEHNH